MIQDESEGAEAITLVLSKEKTYLKLWECSTIIDFKMWLWEVFAICSMRQALNDVNKEFSVCI
jgi:hypothetical protein